MTVFKQWRAPADAEIADGVAELAVFLGETKAAKLSWTRRLVRAEPGGEWGLTITNCAEPSIKTLAPWADPVQLQTWQDAFPLAEAVSILTGPDSANPEKILAARRARVAEYEAAEAAKKAKKLADEKAAKERQLKWEDDCRRFGADAWYRLEAIPQLLFALALRVQTRDPALAADLRALAEEGRRSRPTQFPFPAREWERGT